MSCDLDTYVRLRIVHANAVEWNEAEQARRVARQLDDMLALRPDLDDRFHAFYKECAARSSVGTAEDGMARKIRKHFSGKRVDN